MKSHTAYEKKGARGQTLILGAFSLLFIAVCLFATLGITWQVRNRIQLQHTAEAEAFNVATQTARTYNLFAYTNRAIVGNVVSMTILHSVHTEIGATADIFWSAESVYQMVMEEEMAKSYGCIWIVCFPCKNFQHCLHAAKVEIAALTSVLVKWLNGTMGKQIKGVDNNFTNAMSGLELSNTEILAFQKILKAQLMIMGATGSGDGTTSKLNYMNASKKASSMSLIGGGNIESDSENRKKIEISDIIRASMPSWAKVRTTAPVVTMALLAPVVNSFLKDKAKYWKFGTLVQLPITGGGASFYSSNSGPSSVLPGLLTGFMGKNSKSGKGAMIGSYDHLLSVDGFVNGGCLLPGAGPMTPMLGDVFPATLISKQNSSEHYSWRSFDLFNGIHKGKSHKIELNKMEKSPFGFVSYDFDAVNSDDFKQPTMISSASVNSLSYTYDAKSQKRLPWDMKFDIKLDKNTAKVDMFNSKRAKATAKGMTYYHHPGNWKEAPNFWAPFWRAKLASISSDDVADLVLAGSTDALILTIAGD